MDFPLSHSIFSSLHQYFRSPPSLHPRRPHLPQSLSLPFPHKATQCPSYGGYQTARSSGTPASTRCSTGPCRWSAVAPCPWRCWSCPRWQDRTMGGGCAVRPEAPTSRWDCIRRSPSPCIVSVPCGWEGLNGFCGWVKWDWVEGEDTVLFCCCFLIVRQSRVKGYASFQLSSTSYSCLIPPSSTP